MTKQLMCRCRFWLCLLLPLLMSGCQTAMAEQAVQRELFAMDTYMTMKAYGKDALQALNEAATEIQRLEGLFSVTIPESDLSRLLQANGQAVTVSADTADLLQMALAVAKESGGALDITIYPVLKAWGFTGGAYQVPSEETLQALLPLVDYRAVQIKNQTVTLPKGAALDFGAVAKGYAADRVSSLLRRKGITSALLNLGGSVRAVGTKPDGSRWQVGIANPQGGDPIAVIEAEDCTVITSGSYERYFTAEDGKRYHHILDPKTGCPVQNSLTSVTVIGKSGTLCDALSTAFFVMGMERGMEYCRQHSEIEVLWIDEDNHLYITEGLADVITTQAPCTVLSRGEA